ncbi:unnamed protein product [Mytilus coruscus]|uniref:Uncharacterized protein n=1 Tax=Mytilus coruscus TaxID=42192 RepID=A0A6J8ETR4_MYTCO|nr:unnamed protein product [Mytilus coruscus]
MNSKLPQSACVDGLAAQGTSPSVDAAVRIDSNSDSVHVQKTVENLLKQKLLDINANVVQTVDKPISDSPRRPHFNKFIPYDEQMSTKESNIDQVSCHAPKENLDDCGSHSSQLSCQMYTCTPVEIPQGAPDASDPVEWISLIHKIANVLNIEPEGEAQENERPSFVSARLKVDKTDKKSAIKLPLEGTIIDTVKSVEKEAIAGQLKTELSVAETTRLSWLKRMILMLTVILLNWRTILKKDLPLVIKATLNNLVSIFHLFTEN